MLLGVPLTAAHKFNPQLLRPIYLHTELYIQACVEMNLIYNIARDLNSTSISKYVTLKVTDVLSKHVW